MSAPAKSLATAETLLSLGEDGWEVIHGALARKADPSAEHGDAQLGVGSAIRVPFHRSTGGPDGPGGWWILSEVDVELQAHEVYRPDLVGWRRARVPERPRGRPVRVRPDWVCEILSTSNAKTDLVDKLDVHWRCEIPHYWILDPASETLTVHRWTADGYLIALRASKGGAIRAEPFDEIEMFVGSFFGDE